VYKKELELAVRAAREAGALLKQRVGIRVDSDEGKDIKLSSDKKSEKRIIELLQAESAYPILAEECGMLGVEREDGYRWIVDPLDGTVNYFRGMDELTCVSIALWKGWTPILGVVYRYAADELYCGVVGEGAFCNGRPLSVSGISTVGQAVVATGFPSRRDYDTQSLTGFVRLVQNFKKVRMLGTAAVMGVLVAAGRADAYMEDQIMLWDVAASAAIVSAAGGIVSVQRLEDNKCICRFFANEALMEDFYAKSL